jgi:hypothetical protein
MAIAYGICDNRLRKEAILSKIETLMQKEKLFMWPINFFPYQPDEGYKENYPFPNYENGDIFLGWGEVGIRAYQDYYPSIAVKYIKNVLKQYEKDGLAYQRYDRIKQEGQGNDILAGNCLSVVGLYRDIYGIQPMYNRLYLDPHITGELNGTQIKYWLRNQNFTIHLSLNDYSMSTNSFSVSSSENFSISTDDNKLLYFNRNDPMPALTISRDKQSEIRIKILSWNNDNKGIKKWLVIAGPASVKTDFNIFLLKAGCSYKISKNGVIISVEKSDSNGKIHFSSLADSGKEDLFEIKQAE